MIDMKWMRDHPDALDHNQKRRGEGPVAATILALDGEKRRLQTALQEKQQRRGLLAKLIGEGKKKGDDTTTLSDEAIALKGDIADLEGALAAENDRLQALWSVIPNLLADDVPDGPDETGNRCVRTWGDIPVFSFEPKRHFDIGEALGMMDFDGAARMAGARFTVLRGGLARLERALGLFMLDTHHGSGYTEVSPPLLVRDEAVFGTGQYPKFADDLFQTKDGRWLIPTAEVSLTNLVRDRILAPSDLPMRLTAFTPCFRLEAGAAGKDTRGMIRQHQFYKVELVSIVTPDASVAEHERMTGAAERILQCLGLPYRVMVLCGGDTGLCAHKTYDLEVWLPGEKTYREISSCSNCTDYQARRMNARYRGADGPLFVHTLNGSGLAVGRTLVAILENYQQSDGSVIIPPVLRPYMNGQEVLSHGA